jgi:hypothetical protein
LSQYFFVVGQSIDWRFRLNPTLLQDEGVAAEPSHRQGKKNESPAVPGRGKFAFDHRSQSQHTRNKAYAAWREVLIIFHRVSLLI